MKDWIGGTASVFKTLGASNHSSHERQKEDYYATEPAATEWLCKLEKFDNNILEPCCGEGHISKVLERYGYNVTSRDLVDRGYGEVKDFIDTFEVKEVDLEKETKKWWKEHLHLNPENKLWMDAHQSIVFTKHFYELGLKAQKGE